LIIKRGGNGIILKKKDSLFRILASPEIPDEEWRGSNASESKL